MAAARLPIQYRDTCAHLLVPLNKCRYDQFYMPWKCEVRYDPGKSVGAEEGDDGERDCVRKEIVEWKGIGVI